MRTKTSRMFRSMPLWVLCLTALCVVSSGAFAAVGDITISAPAEAQNTGDTFEVEVTFDAGTGVLGAYDLVFTFDKTIFQVNSVAGGTTSEFSGPPTSNVQNDSGQVLFNAVNAVSLTSPTGVVSIARFTVEVIGNPSGGTSNLGITVTAIGDTTGSSFDTVTPVAGTVTLTEPPLDAVIDLALPDTSPEASSQFTAELTIDVGDKVLGAYDFKLVYDKDVVTVANVLGGSTSEFSGPPTANIQNESGQVLFNAVNAVSLSSPTGVVSIANITFDVVGEAASSTAIEVRVTALGDTGGSSLTVENFSETLTVAAGPPDAVIDLALPETDPAPSSQFTAELTIDVGDDNVLGAYDFKLVYDKDVVTVANVAGGSTSEFSGPPTANIQNESGQVLFNAVNAVSLSSPTGVVSIANITFAVVGEAGASTAIEVRVTALGDTGGSSLTVENFSETLTVLDQDVTDPTAVCQSITVQLDASGAASITAEQVDNGSSDNVGIDSMGVSPSSFSCADLGDNTVTLTVADAAGNAATCEATVTVVDNIAPVAVCQNITVNLSALGTATITAAQLDGGSSDNCGITTMTASKDSFTCADLGANDVTFAVEDASGNGDSCTATVTVVDVTPPTITLTGASPVTVECGGDYTDAGATAIDTCDVDLTNSIIVGGDTVDTTTPGSYTITYNVSDTAGNAATQVTRTVNVTDTTAPVVTLNGADSVTIECGDTYIDAGGTATDSCDSSSLTVTTNAATAVNTAAAGTYTVTLRAEDASGNVGTATREVKVEDTEAPVISLTGAAAVEVECGGIYADQGASATDSCAGDLSANIVVNNPVDTTSPGEYTVTYNVSDATGNAAEQVTRTVTVVDEVAPTLVLVGGNVTVECGDSYTDAGATATDTCEGDLTASIVANGIDAVDTATPGTYTISYNVSDTAGNAADQVARTVQVIDTTIPVITLEGANPLTVDCSDSYTDPGASVEDACDTNLAEVIINSANVVPDVAGTYTVTFSATDEAGNTATATRTVIVDGPSCGEGEGEGHGQEGEGEGQAAVCEDVNSDAIVDNPFICLLQDGSRWDAAANLGGTCARNVSMVTWFGNVAGADVTLTVANPADATQEVTVTVPRGVLAADEQAVLMLTVSCDDLTSLLGAGEAALVGEEPSGFVAGGLFFDVSILVTNDGGATYAELDNRVLEAQPVRLSLNGLAFTPGAVPSFYAYPTEMVFDMVNGFGLEVTAGAAWSAGMLQNVTADGATLTAETAELSIFGAYETMPMGPVLSVSPNPAYDVVAGIVEVGQSVDTTLTLSNIGGGVLNGTATLNDPAGVFTLVSDPNYSLGEAAALTIRFTPAAAQEYTAELTLSGGENDVVITLTGAGTTVAKRYSFFGCSPVTASGAGLFGDLLAIAIVVMALVGFGRFYRRNSQEG